MTGPLAGIRVIDLGRVISGPFCGMLLADLGAEVIRVERSTGADDRLLGALSPSGDSYLFINQNRNKRSITLNFEKSEKARAILDELVKRSDVLLENYSIGAAAAMGITYDRLREVKPDIIFARISAFGASGPYSNRLGFDCIAKAMSGSMSITGPPGPPNRDPISYVDYGTAALTAVGILAALYHRKETGQGQLVDTMLLQTAVTYMAPTISGWETGKLRQQQVANRTSWTGPSDLYWTRDGKWVALAIVTNAIWRRFCKFIGREDLATDPRFRNDIDRWEHREKLDPVVRDWVASHTADETLSLARAIPIPAGICTEQTEVANDPQVKAMKMLTEVSCAGERSAMVTSPPLRMSRTPPEIGRPIQALGQDNEEIYCGLLGYSREDLPRLRDEGVI